MVDLPGTQSLRGRSPDEDVTRDVVLGQRPGEPVPDLLIAVADATNLRAALRLMNELRQTGRPILLVVNMIDIAGARGIEVDIDLLSQVLGVPVVATTAVRRAGMGALWQTLDTLAAAGAQASRPSTWTV